MIILGNLDQEARWVGLALPARVRRRISTASALLSALAPAGEATEVWTDSPVDPDRLIASAIWQPPEMRVGVPDHVDLAWADPRAKAVNDRRFALALASELGVALPGARAITSISELQPTGPWVCKAPWTAAGRDRCIGDGPPTAEQRTRLGRLLETFGALVFEPWLERTLDLGVAGSVAPDGTVTTRAPHTLLVDARGGFVGIDLREPQIADRDRLDAVVAAAGAALARAGYAGPFGVDAFVHRDGLHPLCEINARHTFAHVAHALGANLGFGPAPAAAITLIAAAPDDPVTAWAYRA